MTFLEVEPGTGRILSVVRYHTTNQEDAGLYPNHVVLAPGAEVSSRLDYLVDGEVTPRPEHPATLEGLTLKAVGAEAIVEIEGLTYPCDGTDVDLEFSHPGVYLITLREWPYLDKEFRIEIGA